MSELEKKMHVEYEAMERTGRRVDDAIRAAARVAIEEIKAAFKEGYAIGDDMRYNLTDSLEKYLKQKGYE